MSGICLFLAIIAYFQPFRYMLIEKHFLTIGNSELYLLLIFPLLLLILNFLRIFIGFQPYYYWSLVILVFQLLLSSYWLVFMQLMLFLINTWVIKSLFEILQIHLVSKNYLLSTCNFVLLIVTSLVFQPEDLIINGLITFLLILDLQKTYNSPCIFRHQLKEFKHLLYNYCFAVLLVIILGKNFFCFEACLHFAFLERIISNYPDLIFIYLILNLLIGRYTGLRLVELYRFRNIIFK